MASPYGKGRSLIVRHPIPRHMLDELDRRHTGDPDAWHDETLIVTDLFLNGLNEFGEVA